MDGRNGRKGSGGSRASARRPRRGRRVALTEQVGFKLPPGWLARVDRAAAADGRTRAEWLREAVRRGLDAARKRAAK